MKRRRRKLEVDSCRGYAWSDFLFTHDINPIVRVLFPHHKDSCHWRWDFPIPNIRSWFLTLSHLTRQRFDWQQSCVNNVAQEWGLELAFFRARLPEWTRGDFGGRIVNRKMFVFWKKYTPAKLRGLDHNSGALVQIIFLFKQMICRDSVHFPGLGDVGSFERDVLWPEERAHPQSLGSL